MFLSYPLLLTYSLHSRPLTLIVIPRSHLIRPLRLFSLPFLPISWTFLWLSLTASAAPLMEHTAPATLSASPLFGSDDPLTSSASPFMGSTTLLLPFATSATHLTASVAPIPLTASAVNLTSSTARLENNILLLSHMYFTARHIFSALSKDIYTASQEFCLFSFDLSFFLCCLCTLSRPLPASPLFIVFPATFSALPLF